MRGSHIALVIQVSVTTWDHLICFLVVHVIHHMQLCLWHLEQQLVHGGGVLSVSRCWRYLGQ